MNFKFIQDMSVSQNCWLWTG